MVKVFNLFWNVNAIFVDTNFYAVYLEISTYWLELYTY